MKKCFGILICLMIVVVSGAFGAVNIPDSNLRRAVEAELGKAEGAEITEQEMQTLTHLNVRDRGIGDLTGLESATNMDWLEISYNSISDLTPVAQMTKLRTLWASENEIGTISPLANLTNLRTLGLSNNRSALSLTPLRRLTNLEYLGIRHVSLTNITRIAGLSNLRELDLLDTGLSSVNIVRTLTNLERLNVAGNSISSISPLSGLTNLRRLILANNNISDIAPLVDNEGLGKGDLVWLPGNPLSAKSTNTHIPALRERGVRVKERWTNRDVSRDGRVDVTDLLLVWLALSQPELVGDRADVNGDGSIDIWDLALVAQQLHEGHIQDAGGVAAPTITERAADVSRQTVETWITAVQTVSDGSALFSEVLTNLNHLLELLPPEQTRLLANYPNPFNPETWIPYRLAEDAFVTLTIYDGTGQIVRTINVGHQVAAVYESRSKAIYWDGRNGLGESVASGVYFYHLSAGDFSATRKMLILK